MMGEGEEREGDDGSWDAAASATVLESVQVEPSATAAVDADAIDAPWNCGICGRSNRPEVDKCKLCGAARGRKPNPKIVNFVSKEERTRSASISSHKRSEYKYTAQAFPREAPAVMQGGWTSTSRRLNFDKTMSATGADDRDLPSKPVTLTRSERSDFTECVALFDVASAPSLSRQRSLDAALDNKTVANNAGVGCSAQGAGEKLYAKAFASYGAMPPKKAELDLKPFAAPCAVCSKQSPYRCNQCHEMYYCSREHQRAHWTEHQIQCKPCDKPYVWKAPPPTQWKSAAAAATTTSTRSGASSWRYPSSSTAATRDAEDSSGTDGDTETVVSDLQSAINTDMAMSCGYENHVDADQCPCCYDQYQRHGPNSQLMPRKLPCNHVSCTGCLERMFSYGSVKCPICLRSHKFSSVQEVEVYTTHVLDTINEAEAGRAYELTGTSGEGDRGGDTGGGGGGGGDDGVTYSGDSLIQLVSMGFDESTAQTALRAAKGDIERAVDYCFDPSSIPPLTSESNLDQPHSGGSTSTAQGYEADTADGDDDEWSNPAAVAPLSGAETLTKTKRALGFGSSVHDNAIAGGGGGAGGGKRTKASFQSSDLTTLVGMGFEEQHAADALRSSSWNLETAVMKLTGGFEVDDAAPYVVDDAGVVGTYPPGGKPVVKEVTFSQPDAHTSSRASVVKRMPAHATVNPILVKSDEQAEVTKNETLEETRSFDLLFQTLRNRGLSREDAMLKAREECASEVAGVGELRLQDK